MAQYKTIAGVRYERDLLEFADEETRKSGRSALPKLFAVSLWEQAMDGNGVTETEQRTIKHIMQNYKLAEAAKKYLNEQLAQSGGKGIIKRKSTAKLNGRSGSSHWSAGYYRTIDGQRFDNGLLTQAEEMASKGPITMAEAAQLWANAHDGNGVTECEKRTLRYIGQNFDFTTDAKNLLPQVLDSQGAPREALESEPSRSGARSASGRSGLAVEDSVPAQSSNSDATGRLRALMAPVWNKLSGVFGFAASSSGNATHRNAPLSLPAPPSVARDTPKRKFQEAGDSCDRQSKAPRFESEGGRDSSADMMGSLSPELRELLADASNGTHMLALECPTATAPAVDAELQRQRAEAHKAVQRILAAKTAEDFLGASKAEQREEFKRLSLLLHPDKGLVDADDEQAKLAWRLVLAARSKLNRQNTV